MMRPPPPPVTGFCAFERTQQRPCPVCRSIAAGTTVLQHTPALHDFHPDHLALALAVDRAHAQCLYAERGLHLHLLEIEELPAETRASLDAWAATTAPLPQTFTAQAHHVGAFDEAGHQRCTRCGLLISDRSDPDPYAPGTYAGLDCEAGAGGEQR